jgi:hypothetical protein
MNYCTPKPAGLQVIASRRKPSEPLPEGVLVRVKAEAYEYRIYELEMAYLMQLAGTNASQIAWDACERVKASYHRDYPERPLNPKPRPSENPAPKATGWLDALRKQPKVAKRPAKLVEPTPEKRKRGRPPGSRNAPRQAA